VATPCAGSVSSKFRPNVCPVALRSTPPCPIGLSIIALPSSWPNTNSVPTIFPAIGCGGGNKEKPTETRKAMMIQRHPMVPANIRVGYGDVGCFFPRVIYKVDTNKSLPWSFSRDDSFFTMWELFLFLGCRIYISRTEVCGPVAAFYPNLVDEKDPGRRM
jgi:hypothetical protein